jgi:general secretion pathway protein K
MTIPHQSHIQRLRRGSALVTVFWMIAVLGMMSYAGAAALDSDSRLQRSRILAKRMAETGLEIGRHPSMTLYDPLLSHPDQGGGGFQVTITAEEAGLNINTILMSGETTLPQRLLTRWEVPPQAARP